MKVSFVFLLLSLFLLHAEAYIAIELDPEDLDQVADFFQSIIIHNRQQPTENPTRRAIGRYLKKITFSIFQMMPITTSLVGANLLTVVLEPFVAKKRAHQTEINTVKMYGSSSSISDVNELQQSENNFKSLLNSTTPGVCNIDFGCDDNMCWRTCNTGDQKKILWCYTASKVNSRKFQYCNHVSECSQCWECIETCHP